MDDAPADAVRSGKNGYVTWSVRLTREAAAGYDKFLHAAGLTRAGFFEANGRFIGSTLNGSSDSEGREAQAPESAAEAFDLITEQALSSGGDWVEVVTAEARRIDRERRSRSRAGVTETPSGLSPDARSAMKVT